MTWVAKDDTLREVAPDRIEVVYNGIDLNEVLWGIRKTEHAVRCSR